MKRGNALNVVEITHFFFFVSYLELPEPLILVMVSKQTLDQEAGQDLYCQYIGSWEVQGHGHRNTVGSGVDSLVQKMGHQQQHPGNRQWDVIEVLGFLCVVLAYRSRHVGIRGYLGSDRLTAPPIKRLSWLLFQEQVPSAASHLPTLLTTHHPLKPAALLAASTTELSLLAGTTSHRRCKMLWKGKSLPFRLTVWGGKRNHSGTKRQTRALPLKVWLFWGRAALALPGALLQRLCLGLLSDLLNQSLHVHSNLEWFLRSLSFEKQWARELNLDLWDSKFIVLWIPTLPWCFESHIALW